MTQQRVARRLASGMAVLILAAILIGIVHPDPFITGWSAAVVGGVVAVVMVLLFALVGVPLAFWAASLPDERDPRAAIVPHVCILPPERLALPRPKESDDAANGRCALMG